MQTHSNFISGKWAPPKRGVTIPPTTRLIPVRRWANSRVPGGRTPRRPSPPPSRRFPAWAKTPGPQRGAMLFRFAQLLEDSRNELARIVTLEQGKALGESAGEVSRAAAEARYMAGEASRPIGQTFPSERAGFSCHTVAEPLGRGGDHLPLEFSGGHAGAQNRPGPRLRKYRGLQAGLADTLVRCIPDAVAGEGGFARGGGEPGDRPGLRRSATPWWPTAAYKASPSRVPPASERVLPKARRAAWPACSLSLGARTPPSSSTPTTWMAPPARSSRPRFFAAASGARP